MREPSRIKEEEILEKVIHLILSTGDEELLFLEEKDMAKAVGIDSEQLAVIFKKDRGVDAGTFIAREICHRAAFILEENRDISIALLANHLGFENPVIFEQIFKKYFLVTPGKYRLLRHSSRLCEHGDFK